MPKPFSLGEYELGPRSLEERPALAAHIGQIAAMWSLTEIWLGRLLGGILGTESDVGVAMYLSLISEQARDAALKAAAEEKLSDVMRGDFEALMKRLKVPRKRRNTVVHGVWALPLNNPNALLLIDSRKAVRAMTDSRRHKKVAEMSPDENKRLARALREFHSTIDEYSEQDFIAIENDIERAIQEIKKFWQKFRTGG